MTSPATAPALTQLVKSLRFSWTNSATPGATHRVFRSRGACGAYVEVASGIGTPYIDANVSNGEVYAYYVVAESTAGVRSAASAVVSQMYVGPADQYQATLTADGLTERRGAVAVATNYNGIPQGCGEFQRLQKLRGRATLCGK